MTDFFTAFKPWNWKGLPATTSTTKNTTIVNNYSSNCTCGNKSVQKAQGPQPHKGPEKMHGQQKQKGPKGAHGPQHHKGQRVAEHKPQKMAPRGAHGPSIFR